MTTKIPVQMSLGTSGFGAIKKITSQLGLMSIAGKSAIGLAAIAVADLTLSSIKAFASVDDKLREANSKFDGFGDNTRETLNEIANAISDSFNIPMANAIEILDQLGGANIRLADAEAYAVDIARLMRAGFMDQTTAALLLITANKGLKVSIDDLGYASDQMLTIMDDGVNVTGPGLLSFLSNVSAQAGLAGVPLAELGGFLQAASDRAVDAATAGTYFNRWLAQLRDTSKQTGARFREMTGLTFDEFIAKGGTVSHAIRLIDEDIRRTGTTTAEWYTLIQAQKFHEIYGSPETVEAYTEKIATSFETTEERLSEAMGGTGEDIRKLETQFKQWNEETGKFFIETGSRAYDWGEAIKIGVGIGIREIASWIPGVKGFEKSNDDATDSVTELTGSIEKAPGPLDAFGTVVETMPGLLDSTTQSIIDLNEAVLRLSVDFIDSVVGIANTAASLGTINASLGINIDDMFTNEAAKQRAIIMSRIHNMERGVSLDWTGGRTGTGSSSISSADDALKQEIRNVQDQIALTNYHLENAETAEEARSIGDKLIALQEKLFSLTDSSVAEEALAFLQLNDDIKNVITGIEQSSKQEIEAIKQMNADVTNALNSLGSNLVSVMASASGRGEFDPVTGQFLQGITPSNQGIIDSLKKEIAKIDEERSKLLLLGREAALSGNVDELTRLAGGHSRLDALERTARRRLSEEQKLGRQSQSAQQMFSRNEHAWALAQARGVEPSDIQDRIEQVEEYLRMAQTTSSLEDDRRWELELIRLNKQMDDKLKKIEKNTRDRLIPIEITVQALETSLGRQQFQDAVVRAFRDARVQERV